MTDKNRFSKQDSQEVDKDWERSSKEKNESFAEKGISETNDQVQEHLTQGTVDENKKK